MSTSMALKELVEDITNAIDGGMFTIGILIDLKKAFETINHIILIDKLAHYGCRGIAKQCMKSYLENRLQCVCDLTVLTPTVHTLIVVYRKDLS